jgi:hypothetical protein
MQKLSEEIKRKEATTKYKIEDVLELRDEFYEEE